MSMQIPGWLRKHVQKTYGRKQTTVSPYRAVAVSAGLEDCCKTVSRLAGKRFLMRNAPALPLQGCDMAQCKCRYVKFEDRRQGPRRGSEFGIATTFVRDDERRGDSGGRRKTDL